MKIYVLKILDSLSLISSYLLCLSFIFILQYFTIGLLPLINNIIIFNSFYLKDIIFLIISVYISTKYFKFNTPYRNHLSN